MSEVSIRECGERLLPWTAYGDSAGLPYETKQAEEIADDMQERAIAGEEPHSLQPTDRNPYIDQQPVGAWSDDTILSRAVAEAVFEDAEKPLLEVIADKHVEVYRKYIEPYGKRKFGFGKSTSRSMERLLHGVHYTESGEVGGSGNGVLMKLTPLAYFHATSEIEQKHIDDTLSSFTFMTHKSAVAAAATQVHHDILTWLINEADPRTHRQLLDLAHDLALGAEENYMGMDKTLTGPVISQRLGKMALLRRRLDLTPESIVEINPDKAFSCPGTLAHAYGAFVMDVTFPGNLWQAVRLGGDTDSVASIVGGMSALYPFMEYQEPADIDKLHRIDELRDVSKKLASLVSQEVGM